MPEEAQAETDQSQETPAKSQSLEESLAGLDEATRKSVLDTVGKARKDAAEYRRKLREAGPLIEAGQAKVTEGQTEADKAQAAAAAAEQKLTAYRDKLVAATVRALATAQFQDSADAEAFLDLGSFVDADGEVDEDAVSAALEELLKRKPHLGKPELDSGAPRRPVPDASQGAGAAAGNPALNGDPLMASLRQKLNIR